MSAAWFHIQSKSLSIATGIEAVSLMLYSEYYRCTAVCILTEPFFHSERCHSCDLSSCRWKCKYIQTISSSFLHFKARSDYRRRSITSPLPVFHTSLAISQFPLCLAMSSKCCGSDSLSQKTFKPSKLVLQLICIIEVVHILNQSELSSLVM